MDTKKLADKNPNKTLKMLMNVIKEQAVCLNFTIQNAKREPWSLNRKDLLWNHMIFASDINPSGIMGGVVH